MATTAAPMTAADELLERRRANDRERSRRSREARRSPPAPGPAFFAARSPYPGRSSEPSSSSSSFPIHATVRLESIGSTPEAYSRTPPHVDAPPRAPDPAADQARAAGAAKIALIVAGMFRFALQDATARYEIGQRLVEAGVPLEQANVVMAGAVGHVYASTERACLKHGIGLALPYEDELTAIAAAATSAAYLMAKFTGRLDKQGDQADERDEVGAQRHARRAEPRREAPAPPPPIDPYAPINLEVA